LETGHLNYESLKLTKTFHFGGLSLTHEPARSATYAALDFCKELGIQISFDPNYRETLWDSSDAAIEQMLKGAKYADIIKVGMEEMVMMTGLSEGQIEEGAQLLFDMGIKAVFITDGAKGAYYKTEDEQGFVKGFAVDAIDTTGCGDAFLGAMLYAMHNKEDWPVEEKVRFANASAALCATGRTGFPAMPDYRAVEAFLELRVES
jgi:sugar/nucleoside kinase (ribokinase family)